mgnify:CR=1 FL=1|jgi:hypothetical protein|uniref:Uncharacterized protein n=1 Tax=Siphoviridae sp. ctqwY3 TaxID=2827951 RepID=A0A8S5S6F5_9CAUD|nr:MAG TPA: hypothetical protein [Siphoviridae sp. ctqwY3]
MNIDLTKYLKNKDVKLKNEDFDLDAMSKDLYNGYTRNEDIKPPTDMVSKADYDKLQSDYTALESNYNTTVKTLSDTNSKMARVSLESKLVRKGFKEDQFDEIVKLRNSLYADEKDDQKAVDSIAEKFKNTYFADSKSSNNGTPYTPAPNEGGIQNKGTSGKEGHDIKITRKTSIRDLNVPPVQK